MPALDRRTIIMGFPAIGAALSLAGCAARMAEMAVENSSPSPWLEPSFEQAPSTRYGPIDSDRFPIPALKLSDMNAKFLRKTVPYATAEEPGTIVVDPPNNYLYFVQRGGYALRYGVGVGGEEFGWSGA